MVYTRSMRRRDDMMHDLEDQFGPDSEEECSECEDARSLYGSDHGFDGGSSPSSPTPGPSGIPMHYSRRDVCKRHRFRDNEPYDQQVVSYTRRKPLR